MSPDEKIKMIIELSNKLATLGKDTQSTVIGDRYMTICLSDSGTKSTPDWEKQCVKIIADARQQAYDIMQTTLQGLIK